MFPVYVFLIICIMTFSLYNLKIIELNVYDLMKFIPIVFIINIPLIRYDYLILMSIFISLIILVYMKTRKLYLSFILSILSVIIGEISDVISMNFCVWILRLKLENIKQNYLHYFLYHILIFIVSYFVTVLVRYVLKRKVDLKSINFKSKFSMFTFFSLILTFTIFYVNLVLIKIERLSNEIIIINGFMFFIYFVLLVLIVYAFSNNVKKEMEFDNRKKELDSLKEYTENLEILYNEMRKFRHDYINILTSMVGYMDNNDMEGLRNHFDNKIMPISTSLEKKNFKLGLLQNIKIPEIKGIVSSKLIKAQEKEIDVFIDIMEPVKEINMDIIDICRITGIILDNAVEASEKCKNPSIKLAFVNKKNSLIIVVINSCPESTPPIYKLFEKGFSTKGYNRGLGLNNLKEIISSYSNVSLDTLIENGEFIQSIEVSK